MTANKTVPTDQNVESFLSTVDHPTRLADARVLLSMMEEISGCPPVMWGPTIIGFDQYHYIYDSGREGDMPMIGFSPRKANLSLYIMADFDGKADLLAALGKHKMGKGCLYINKLADVDQAVLKDLTRKCLAEMRRRHAASS